MANVGPRTYEADSSNGRSDAGRLADCARGETGRSDQNEDAGQVQKQLGRILMCVQRAVWHYVLHPLLLRLAGLNGSPRAQRERGRKGCRDRPCPPDRRAAPDGPERSNREDRKKKNEYNWKVHYRRV
jgi:hypothetical protein